MLTVAALPAAAQVGTTTDIITGTVTDNKHHPVAEAEVQVTSLETQLTRNRTSNPRGHIAIVFPDGGGQYQVLVRQADEDRLTANVQLTPVGVELAPIAVRARPGPAGTTTGRRRACDTQFDLRLGTYTAGRTYFNPMKASLRCHQRRTPGADQSRK